MINIAFVHGVPDFSSGASFSLVSLVKEIKKQGKYNPIVILPEIHCELSDYFSKNGIDWISFEYYDHWYTSLNATYIEQIIEQSKSTIRYLQKYRFIKSFLLNNDIKLVHINMLTCGSIAKIAEKLGIPVVWHIREFMEEDLGLKLINKKGKFSLVNKASKVIAISNAVKNKYSDLITPQIKVVYNGIDTTGINSKHEELFIDNKLNITIVGRIFRKKGQLIVAQALEKMYQDHKVQYKLNIAGYIYDKEYFDELNKFIRNNHAESRIVYLGQVSNVPDLLEKMDILIMASVKEAFGRVTVEGLEAGCIVVGANSGGTPEIMKLVKDPYIFEASNVDELSKVIYGIYLNKKDAKVIAFESQKLAQDIFSVSKCANQVIEIYDQILD